MKVRLVHEQVDDVDEDEHHAGIHVVQEKNQNRTDKTNDVYQTDVGLECFHDSSGGCCVGWIHVFQYVFYDSIHVS